MLVVVAVAHAFVCPSSSSRVVVPTRLHSTDVRKRLGDACSLTGLSLYQQGLAIAANGFVSGDVNIGSAIIRGCRLTICLFACEKLFKCLRAPTSQREVPVPLEAAALAMCVNFAVEYNIQAALGADLPRTLSLSLGGSLADGAAAYLTILCWRILYASLGF